MVLLLYIIMYIILLCTYMFVHYVHILLCTLHNIKYVHYIIMYITGPGQLPKKRV